MNQLTPAAQKFIVHWGEMGERWGINRTVAQIHALLYISPEPLNAEEISETLSVARSTVSAGLKELQNWGIIKIAHVLGDRTDHFEAMGDVWEMARIIVDMRKRRELDPTLNMLREAAAEFDNENETALTRKRLADMLDLLETVSAIYEQGQKIPTKTIARIAKNSEIVRKVLNLFPDS
jgi:DNA-binding transcriptional regulator GbsR (MarR family)